jgi:hypothetical protein
MNIAEQIKHQPSPDIRFWILRPDRDASWLADQEYRSLVHMVVEGTRTDIDAGACDCVTCHERILSYDGNTAFVLLMEIAGVRLRAGACCGRCSLEEDENLALVYYIWNLLEKDTTSGATANKKPCSSDRQGSSAHAQAATSDDHR